MKLKRNPGRESCKDRLAEAIRERDAASASALLLLQTLEKLFYLTRAHISGRMEIDIGTVIRKVKRGK